MELFAIGICALCAVLFAALVQKTNKEYALLISLGTAAVLLLCAGELTALRRRPDRGLLAGLGEPVTLPGTPDEAQVRRAVEEMGGAVRQLVPLPAAKHVFTHVEWHMTGYTLEVAGDGPADFVWAGAEELGERAVPSAFARYSDEAKRRLGGWKED